MSSPAATSSGVWAAPFCSTTSSSGSPEAFSSPAGVGAATEPSAFARVASRAAIRTCGILRRRGLAVAAQDLVGGAHVTARRFNVGEVDGVAHLIAHDIQQARQREVEDVAVLVLQGHIEVSVALDDRLVERANRALHGLHVGGRAAVALGHHAVGGQQGLVGLLGVGHRIAHGHVLIALDVDHGELLHEARAVLQGHEVRGLVAHIDEQRERGCVAQVLHLALGRFHGRVLGGAGHRIEVGLLGTLVHQHEADDGVVGRGRGDAGVHPHIVVLGDVVVAERAVGARRGAHHALLAEERVQPPVVVGAPPVVLLDEQFGREHAVDPLGALLHRQVLSLARGGVA